MVESCLHSLTFDHRQLRSTSAPLRWVKPSTCSLPLSACLSLSPATRSPSVGKRSNPWRPQFRLSWLPVGDKPYQWRNSILMNRVICRSGASFDSNLGTHAHVRQRPDDFEEAGHYPFPLLHNRKLSLCVADVVSMSPYLQLAISFSAHLCFCQSFLFISFLCVCFLLYFSLSGQPICFWLSICLPVLCLSCLSFYISLCLPLYFSLFDSVCRSVCLSLIVSLSISLFFYSLPSAMLLFSTVSQSTSQSGNKSTSKSGNQSVRHPVSQATSQPVRQATSQSVSH